MRFTQRDIGILISMTIAVVFMSLTFPSMGIAAEDTSQNDIPEFNITTDRFGGYLDKPELPQSPNRGILNHSSTEFDDFEGSIQVVLGTNSNGNDVLLVAIEENEVHITNTSAASGVLENHIFTSEGEIATLSGDGYTVDVIANDLTYGEFEWQVEERPGESSLFEGIPILGTVAEAISALTAVIAWFVQTVFFYLIQLGSGILNTLTILFDLVVFLITFFHWLITTYGSIISSAPNSWTALLVTIPGLLLSFEFAKVILVILSMIPTTGG